MSWVTRKRDKIREKIDYLLDSACPDAQLNPGSMSRNCAEWGTVAIIKVSRLRTNHPANNCKYAVQLPAAAEPFWYCCPCRSTSSMSVCSMVFAQHKCGYHRCPVALTCSRYLCSVLSLEKILISWQMMYCNILIFHTNWYLILSYWIKKGITYPIRSES